MPRFRKPYRSKVAILFGDAGSVYCISNMWRGCTASSAFTWACCWAWKWILITKSFETCILLWVQIKRFVSSTRHKQRVILNANYSTNQFPLLFLLLLAAAKIGHERIERIDFVIAVRIRLLGLLLWRRCGAIRSTLMVSRILQSCRMAICKGGYLRQYTILRCRMFNDELENEFRYLAPLRKKTAGSEFCFGELDMSDQFRPQTRHSE